MSRPKSQFCKYGHDTFIVGRDSNNYCVSCKNKTSKQYSKINRKRIFKYTVEYNWDHKYNIKNADGSVFTRIDYDRLYQIQQGKCAICGVHQSELKRALSVDHDHKTGQVRGLLCSTTCNRYLSILEREDWMKQATDYLEKTRTSQILK